MKSILPFVLAALLALAPLASAAADATDQKVQALRAELDKYLATLAKSPDQRARYGGDAGAYVQAAITRITSDLKQGNYESADQQLRMLGQQIPTPGAGRIVGELLAEVQATRDQRDNAWVGNVEALVARARPQSLAAKNEKDLDALLEETSNLRGNPNSRSGQNDRLQRATQKVESLSYFVRRWQDYLAQLNAGNDNAARQVLQELSSDNGSRYPIVPRSELLARVTVPQSRPAVSEQGTTRYAAAEVNSTRPAPYVFEVASLDELPAALDRMRRHYADIPIPSEDSNLLQSFSSIVSATAAAEAGNLQPAFQAALNQGTVRGPGISERTNALRLILVRALMQKVLPRFLDVKPELAPKSDENPADYCLRIARTAREAGDWQLVARALEAYERVAFPGGQVPAWLSTDRTALSAYLLALNQEKAGDLESALVSLNRTLVTQGSFVPVDDIAARIIRARKGIEERRAAEQRRLVEANRRLQQATQPPR
jgi:hypothetical protein